MHSGAYKVKIRRGEEFIVKPEAEQIDGRSFFFTVGWVIEDDDYLYPGEYAMIPEFPLFRDPEWPEDAPIWIASGDLVSVY